MRLDNGVPASSYGEGEVDSVVEELGAKYFGEKAGNSGGGV